MTRSLRMLVPVACLATGACFATRSDVRLLHDDLQAARAERARADSALHQELTRVLAAVGTVNDSVKVVSERLTAFQGNVRGELFEIGQQLVMIQELTGQSQRRLQEVRASLEQRLDVAPPPAAGDTTKAPGSSPVSSGVAPGEPGPNTLFQLALDQLRRGSAGAARLAFGELLSKHPTSDVADDAQFYIGEALAAEGKAAAADSAYALVVATYPQSPRAPTALFKRALAKVAANDTVTAKAMFNELIERFPRSDEAALSRERLRTLP